MKNRWSYKVTVRDAAYWCAMTILAACFALPFATSFSALVLQVNLLRSLVYLALSLCLTLVYCLKCSSANQGKVVIGALCMLVACTIVYSVVRQELVLMVYPSLFCLPGALFGYALAMRRAGQKASLTAEPI